jgi:hypothetical protein
VLFTGAIAGRHAQTRLSRRNASPLHLDRHDSVHALPGPNLGPDFGRGRSISQQVSGVNFIKGVILRSGVAGTPRP